MRREDAGLEHGLMDVNNRWEQRRSPTKETAQAPRDPDQAWWYLLPYLIAPGKLQSAPAADSRRL
jgi:hypothetical protein